MRLAAPPPQGAPPMARRSRFHGGHWTACINGPSGPFCMVGRNEAADSKKPAEAGF